MARRVRHLNTKFADDPAESAQLIARKVKKSMGFRFFPVKKGFFDVIKWRQIFLHFLRTKKFSFVAKHNCLKFGLIQKGVLDFQKNIRWQVSQKCRFWQ